MGRGPLAWTGLTVVWWGAVVWALFSMVSPWLSGETAVVVFAVSLPMTVWEVWRGLRADPPRPPTADALRRHRDPGPELRAAVDERARDLLTPLREGWLIGAGSLALAAGAAAAVLRGEPLLGTPAVLLVAFVAWLAVRTVVLRGRARRWLAEPPYARVEEQP